MSVSAECNFVKLLKAPAAPDSVRDAASSDGPSVVQRLRNEVGWLSAGLAWLSAGFGWPLHPAADCYASASSAFERLTEPPPRERRFGPPKKKSRRWALTNSRNAKLLQGHKLRCFDSDSSDSDVGALRLPKIARSTLDHYRPAHFGARYTWPRRCCAGCRTAVADHLLLETTGCAAVGRGIVMSSDSAEAWDAQEWAVVELQHHPCRPFGPYPVVNEVRQKN